jgi:hypothetical protein
VHWLIGILHYGCQPQETDCHQGLKTSVSKTGVVFFGLKIYDFDQFKVQDLVLHFPQVDSSIRLGKRTQQFVFGSSAADLQGDLSNGGKP